MSIKDGKAKDWGSRSGKSKSKIPENLGLFEQLNYLGLTNNILDSASENPEELINYLKDLKNTREDIKKQSNDTKLRKVFSTANGTLYNGDCIKLMAKKIEDNSIDCIFADPPFNLSKMYGNGINDQVQDMEYLEWTRAWLDLCCEKLKDGGSFFVYNIPKWSTYISHYLSQRLDFKHWIAVDLTLSMPIKNKLYPSHYSLLYFTKGKRPNHFSPPRLPLKACVRCGQEQNDYGGYKKKMHPEGLTLRDIWTDIPPVRHKKYKNRDANELSIKLVERVLDIATQEGDLVFDPFGGAGTTYAAAEHTGRKWIGVELGDCEPIVERFKTPEVDLETLRKNKASINKLFTDKTLRNRHAHDLPLNNYRVSEEQITSALNKE